jgi:hypothetical protein
MFGVPIGSLLISTTTQRGHVHQTPGGAAAGVLDSRSHVAGIVFVGTQSLRPPHLHMREPLQPSEEFGIDEGLNESIAPRPTEGLCPGGDLGEELVLAVDESQDLIGNGVLQDLMSRRPRPKAPSCSACPRVPVLPPARRASSAIPARPRIWSPARSWSLRTPTRRGRRCLSRRRRSSSTWDRAHRHVGRLPSWVVDSAAAHQLTRPGPEA